MSEGTDNEGEVTEAASIQRDKIDRAKLLLSEGFIIAAASACCYLLAFYYEKGYTEHFSIPLQLINVSLVNLLIFIALALGFLVLLVIYLNPFLDMLGGPRSRYLFMILLMGTVPVYLYGLSEWRHWLPIVGAVLVGVALSGLVIFGLPLLTHRKAGDVQARYEAQAGIDRANPTFVIKLERWLGFDVYFLFSSLIMFTYLASVAGKAEALQQKAFYVTNTMPEMVVLRIYGDTMIAAPFNRATKEVHKSFRLLKVSDGTGPALTLEGVGPLKPAPAPTPAPPPAKAEPESSQTPVPPPPAPAESPKAGAVREKPDPPQLDIKPGVPASSHQNR